MQLFLYLLKHTKEHREKSNRWAWMIVCCYGNKVRSQLFFFSRIEKKPWAALSPQTHELNLTCSAFKTFEFFWKAFELSFKASVGERMTSWQTAGDREVWVWAGAVFSVGLRRSLIILNFMLWLNVEDQVRGLKSAGVIHSFKNFRAEKWSQHRNAKNCSSSDGH